MAIITLQSEIERKRGICYQFDPATPPIGEGGMGRVYQGVCLDLKTKATRPVAIKFMYDDLPPSAYERARRESEIQLRNDNLVEMLGFIETEERISTGEVYKHYHVVSELLTGVSLSDIIEGKTKDRNGEDVPFAVKMLQDYRNDSEHFARTIVTNVLSGLMALHDAGYIHRDIDPSNIMLTSDGHIKLIDFGIAKQMRLLTTGDKALTVAGKFMGKPEYAAPELVLGDITHQNQTTDIYAVGILLYQCVVGHTPFEGARHEVLEAQLRAKMNLKVIRNRALKNIIATACEKKQEYRYQTAAQMRVALENLSGKKRAISPSRIKMMVGGVVVVIVILVSILSVVRYKQTKAQEKANAIAMAAKLEQDQQQAKNMMEKSLSEAESLYQKGKLQEDEDYEQYLISAYKLYAAYLDQVQSDSVLAMFEGEIRQRMDSVLRDIQATQVRFLSQAEGFLKDAEDKSLSEQYQAKSDSLKIFLKKLQ